MKRTARTIVVFAVAAAALVAFNPAANADVTIPSGDVYVGTFALGSDPSAGITDIDPTGLLIGTINTVAHTCVPKSETTTINDPVARVYLGATDSIYLWSDVATSTLDSCTSDKTCITVKLLDQALDGSSLPSTDPQTTTACGTGSASAMAQAVVDYTNVALATGSPHQITMVVNGTATDPTVNKTVATWCASRSWTYLATLAGPEFLGSTSTSKCGS